MPIDRLGVLVQLGIHEKKVLLSSDLEDVIVIDNRNKILSRVKTRNIVQPTHLG